MMTRGEKEVIMAIIIHIEDYLDNRPGRVRRPIKDFDEQAYKEGAEAIANTLYGKLNVIMGEK